MKSIYCYLSVFIAVIAALPACNFLNVDDYFSDELKLDSVFAEKRYVEAYLWGTANMFPDESDFFYAGSYTPGVLATDEAFTMFASGGYHGMRYVLGEISAASGFGQWGNLYRVIRKCNTLFARMDEAKDLTARERLDIAGYTRFFRAYAYYHLFTEYGPPILLDDDIVASNEEIPFYDRARCTVDEAVEYICGELEAAASLLEKSHSLMNFGRPTQGAAYALIARLRLLHASPIYNGGAVSRRYFGNWTRKTDGVHYVKQNLSEDVRQQRWALAAAAARRVMDMIGASGAPLYKLHTVDEDSRTPELPSNSAVVYDAKYSEQWADDGTGGAEGIDHFKSYSDMFTGEAITEVNPEFIWARRGGAIGGSMSMSFPRSVNGWNGMSVTQKVIDAYSMQDGSSIQASNYPYIYDETGFTTQQTLFSEYRLNANVSNMYVNREMRFYASIGFSECYWPMTSTDETGKHDLTIRYYYSEANGKAAHPTDYPPTGYVIKKYIHRDDAISGTNSRIMQKSFPIIRYAEILLSYAEALNNLTGSQTVTLDGIAQTFERNPDEIKRAFNQVRYRAGLPGLKQEELDDPANLQAAIEKERMVEFLFENRRYYDVRRWGIYEQTESEPVMGMNMDGLKESFYRRSIPNTSRIGGRIVNKKLVLLPIPLNEIRALPSLDQNPGWEE